MEMEATLPVALSAGPDSPELVRALSVIGSTLRDWSRFCRKLRAKSRSPDDGD